MDWILAELRQRRAAENLVPAIDRDNLAAARVEEREACAFGENRDAVCLCGRGVFEQKSLLRVEDGQTLSMRVGDAAIGKPPRIVDTYVAWVTECGCYHSVAVDFNHLVPGRQQISLLRSEWQCGQGPDGQYRSHRAIIRGMSTLRNLNLCG